MKQERFIYGLVLLLALWACGEHKDAEQVYTPMHESSLSILVDIKGGGCSNSKTRTNSENVRPAIRSLSVEIYSTSGKIIANKQVKWIDSADEHLITFSNLLLGGGEKVCIMANPHEKHESLTHIPIEDIQPENLENSNIQDDNILNSSEVNPGFMDIDKIAEDAKDIPTAVEKDPVDINSLLKPSIIGQEEPISQEAPKEELEEELKVGKFFTLPNEEEKNIENNVSATEKNVATGITEVFNFDLDNNEEENLIMNQTDAPKDVAPLEVTQNIETLPSTFDEEPVSNINGLEISTELNKTEEAPIASFDNPVIGEPITPETVVENPSASQIADEDLTNNIITPDFNFNISTPVEREELVVKEPLSSEDMPVPTISTPNESNKNISDALELIRNSSKQLEKMGYVIDTEEFDFETAYQVIIKIEK